MNTSGHSSPSLNLQKECYTTNLEGKVVDLQDENIEYLYIITLEKKILIAERSPKIRHLSLSKGDSVLGAGTIKVKAGQIVYCDVESGHYQPSVEHMQQVIDIFNGLGAILSEDLVIKYYGKQGKIITTLKHFSRDDINKILAGEK